jgi:flagellar motor switch protein FliG
MFRHNNECRRIARWMALGATLFVTNLTPLAPIARGNEIGDKAKKMVHETKLALQTKINSVLLRHCPDACELLDIDVNTEESIQEDIDIGFEGLKPYSEQEFTIQLIRLHIQIDERITVENRQSLTQLLQTATMTSKSPVQVQWHPIKLPKIGELVKSDQRLTQELKTQTQKIVEAVLNKHCPNLCVLSEVAVDAAPISADDAKLIPPKRVYQYPGIDGVIRVDTLDIELAFDSRVDESRQRRIQNLIQAQLKWVEPIYLRGTTTDFPETYAEDLEKQKQDAEDPFQLGRLRETLKAFRELAGTKEIITSTVSSQTDTSEQKLSSEQRESTSQQQSTKDTDTSRNQIESNAQQTYLEPWFLATAGGILVIIVLSLVFALRFGQAKRQAHEMMMVPSYRDQHTQTTGGFQGSETSSASKGANAPRDLSLRLRIAELKEELTHIFINAPKVAKETYGRILQDEGVEQTSKYVHIFGHTVIYELLEDPNYQRHLFELSEYHHNTEHKLSLEDELALLESLKTKVTATEIKVLSQKTMEKFDFLMKLDANQIHDLIRDEKPAVQCIALTQLDHRRRRLVFEMFIGQSRIDLMQELCRADAIPKDYLSSVANALTRKISASAKFDTAKLRSNDILFDLLERAPIVEQRNLMQNLQNTNAEAARGIKMKLITIETLLFLKDGHLLDIILNIDRQHLLVFLKAAPPHLQELLLSKVPEELAMSWQEELAQIAGTDDKSYRMVEMQVINKIRNLSSTGALNILEINEMIFGQNLNAIADPRENISLQIPRNNLVA